MTNYHLLTLNIITKFSKFIRLLPLACVHSHHNITTHTPGIKNVDTFTPRWRTHYLLSGPWKFQTWQWQTRSFYVWISTQTWRPQAFTYTVFNLLLSRVKKEKKDIIISDVSHLTVCLPWLLTPAITPLTITCRHGISAINKTLLKSFPVGRIDKCSGLRRQIFYETAHQWILTCGCLYKTVKKSCINS